MDTPPTATLYYARHFLLLGAFAAVLAVVPWLGGWGPAQRFALYGALHATLLVVSLRQPGPISRRAAFVAGAALFSYLNAAITVYASRFVPTVSVRMGASVLLAASSGVGCLAYAYWIRWYWLRSLRFRGVLGMALGCMIGTVTAFLASIVLNRGVGYLWVVIAWWGTFSMGLWHREGRVPDR